MVLAMGGHVDGQTVSVAPKETAKILRSSGSRHHPKVGQRPLETLPGYSEGQGLGHRTSLICEVSTSAACQPKIDIQGPKGYCLTPRSTKASRWFQPGMVLSVKSDQERSPNASRPCATEATSSRATQTTIISKIPREGHQGAANQQGSSFPRGERCPSWGRPTDTCSNLWAQPGADLEVLVQKAESSSNGAARGGEIQQAQAPEPLVRMLRAPGNQRVDKWWCTLPNDVHFEEYSFLVPKQRQSDYLGPSSTALRDPTPAHKRAEGQEERPGGSRDPAPATGKPVSQEEPRATFFALTCQLPEAQKPKNSKPETPPFMEPSRKMAPPPSPQLSSSSVSVGQEEPSEPRVSKNCARGRERDGISFSKPQKPASTYLPSGGDRFLDPSGEKKDVGAFWAQQASEERIRFLKNFRNDIPLSTPCFRSQTPYKLDYVVTASLPAYPRDSCIVSQKMVSEVSSHKFRDHFQTTVLDIDTLMKEPAWDPIKAQNSSSVQANCFSPKKQGQQGRMDCARRKLKEGQETEGSWKARPAAWMEPVRRCTRNREEGGGGGPRTGTSPHHRLAPLDVKRTCSKKGPPAHIQEGQSVLQDAGERRREQSKGRSSLPTETSGPQDPQKMGRTWSLEKSTQFGQKFGTQDCSKVFCNPEAKKENVWHLFRACLG